MSHTTSRTPRARPEISLAVEPSVDRWGVGGDERGTWPVSHVSHSFSRLTHVTDTATSSRRSWCTSPSRQQPSTAQHRILHLQPSPSSQLHHSCVRHAAVYMLACAREARNCLIPVFSAALLVLVYVCSHEAGHAVSCVAVGFRLKSVCALGIRLYPLPPGLAPATPTPSFVGVTRCSLREKVVENMVLRHSPQAPVLNASDAGRLVMAQIISASDSRTTEETRVLEQLQWSSLAVEQGLVLLGGYMGTSVVQALALMAVWSRLSVTAVSNEVQEGVDKIWRALRNRERIKGEDRDSKGGGGVTDSHWGAGRQMADEQHWRWSGVNTAFACTLTALGVMFTRVQVLVLKWAYDSEEERRKRRRMLLSSERAAIRRVETR